MKNFFKSDTNSGTDTRVRKELDQVKQDVSDGKITAVEGLRKLATILNVCKSITELLSRFSD